MIIAFDLTNQESFENVKGWMNSIYKHSDPSIAKVLVGNKLDLEQSRVVSTSEAKKIAAEHGMEYFETSARDNINIQEVMQYIMGKVYDNLYAVGSNDMQLNGSPSIVIGAKGSTHKTEERTGECKC